MKRLHSHTYPITVFFAVIMLLITQSMTAQKLNSDKVKIALRAAGNELLLVNHDSVSRIHPIVQLSENEFELSFESSLTFEPSELVVAVATSFQKAQLPETYRVQVIQCSDREVAYSYEITPEEETTIIPCTGRYLPENCYTIQVRFTEINESWSVGQIIILVVAFDALLLFLIFYFKNRKNNQKKAEKPQTSSQTTLGIFTFYPEQHKLVQKQHEIPLSGKECELLQIFVERPNEIIKRDELIKKVWEDNGVIVGRSLDTYISKLRKKLKADTRIKITNVHGVGYRLEIES